MPDSLTVLSLYFHYDESITPALCDASILVVYAC